MRESVKVVAAFWESGLATMLYVWCKEEGLLDVLTALHVWLNHFYDLILLAFVAVRVRSIAFEKWFTFLEILFQLNVWLLGQALGSDHWIIAKVLVLTRKWRRLIILAWNFNRVKLAGILYRMNRLASLRGFRALGYLLVCLDRLAGAHGMLRNTSFTHGSLCTSCLLVRRSLTSWQLRLRVETWALPRAMLLFLCASILFLIRLPKGIHLLLRWSFKLANQSIHAARRALIQYFDSLQVFRGA